MDANTTTEDRNEMTMDTAPLPALIDAWPHELTTGHMSPSDSLPSQLRGFLDDWAIVTTTTKARPDEPALAVRLRNFFDFWPEETEIRLPEEPSINAEALTCFFRDFRPVLDGINKERQSGSAVNVWRAAGLNRDELRNSRVLAWFLDAHGDHGQGSAILRRLLDRITEVAGSQTYWGSAILRSLLDRIGLLTNEHDLGRYWTSLEKRFLGDTDSRVDIEIEGDRFLLFIEVKIDAGETGNQLDRYIDIAANKAKGRPWAVAFLTPTGCRPKEFNTPPSDHPPVVPISWRDVSEEFREHANSLPDCFARRLIHQYIEHIRSF